MILSSSEYHLLAFLHDAKCTEIVWDCNNPDSRTLHIGAIADSEAGYPLWDGKALRITLGDIVAARLIAWGYTMGDESFDSWRVGVSDSFESECKALTVTGIAVPPVRLSISFRSGSTLEVACSGVS